MRLVITGSSSGIGRALALRLLDAGHEVWGLARSDQSAMAADHGRFHPVVCDVGDPDAVQRAAGAVREITSTIDAIVTCAAIHGTVGRTLELAPEAWLASVNVNLGGVIRVLHAFRPLLVRPPGHGKVVCFSGGGATRARPGFSAYASAKTALVRLVETIAAEERDTLLDINAIAPGAIPTRLTDEILALGPNVVGPREYDAALRAKQGGPEALHKALDLVTWLLSAGSDGVSGRLFSAQWDAWPIPADQISALRDSDLFTLRRNTTLPKLP